MRPPVLCYPVCDLDSECPVGWTAGKTAAPAATQTVSSIDAATAEVLTVVAGVHGVSTAGAAAPRLQDCLQLKPGSTVGDVFEALKRGVLSHSAAVVHGEFVRADARSLTVLTPPKDASAVHAPVEQTAARVVQLRKDSVVNASNCVLRVQTNRKSVWQGGGGAAAATANSEGK